MVGELLRAAHAPAWVIFAVVFGLYICTASWWLINGYTRELFGSHMPHMGRIHHVVYNFHTGLPIQRKSYGDEKRLRKSASDTRRATPDGLKVYYHPWKRWQRALRNNLIIAAWLLSSCGMAIDPNDTVRAITLLILALLGLFCYSLIHKARERHRKSHPISQAPVVKAKPAKLVLRADAETVGDTPKLEAEKAPALEGVPQTVLANFIAPLMGCSTDELLRKLTMTADQGKIILPDTFAARIKEREAVQEVIEGNTKGKVRFNWNTTNVPRTLEWVPVVIPKLPVHVRFRDYLPQIEKLGPRETGLSVRTDKSMYVQTHNGDLPWWCRFMGSGAGKSMGFLIKAAQIAHKDPLAEIFCIDTKQISFEPLHGIPGIHIFDNPVTQMDRIWQVFYDLAADLESRYEDVRLKRRRLTDFHDKWVFVDEGNHLGDKLKIYHKKVLGETSATPAIWSEAIAPLIQQGRQARIFGEWMFQDLTDRAVGGISLKFGFSAFCAGAFSPNQLARTIGPPAEECLDGPGRILVCQGNKRTWTQGFIDDEQWLHDYALENRKEMTA